MALQATRQGDIVHTNNFKDFGGGLDWLLQFNKTVEYKG